MKDLTAPSAQCKPAPEDDRRRVVLAGNAAHKDVPVRCPACDRTVKRRSRQQIFCSTRCRMKAWRKETPADELKNEARCPCSGGVTNPDKSFNKNNILQWPKSRSGISWNGPINLLGGGSWRWPDAGQLDSKTLANIRWCEVGGELIEAPE